MKRPYISIACLCILLVTTLFSSRNALADSGNPYGAIAYSMARSTPYFAFADSKVAAEADALNNCYQAGANDCNVALWGQNAFLAISIDFSWADMSNRPWGTGWGDTQAEAEQYARQECESHGGHEQTCLISSQSTANANTNSANGGSGWGAMSTKIGKAIAWANSSDANQSMFYGNCEKFVEYAYGIYGGTADGGYISAQQAFNNLPHSTGQSPDLGALVFFKYFNQADQQDDGHVGIYLGDGQFISALQTNPVVQIRDLQTWSTAEPYEGWADPPSGWQGR
jgi:cell wall-associated NlpC family hydrolase